MKFIIDFLYLYDSTDLGASWLGTLGQNCSQLGFGPSETGSEWICSKLNVPNARRR